MFFILTLIGILVFVYIYLIWNFDYWSKLGVPGPKPTVLFGNLPSVITRKINMTYELLKYYEEFKDKSQIIGLFYIRTPVLLVVNPEMANNILVKQFKNFHDNEFSAMISPESDPLLGRNPFMLRGEEWKEKRTEITPAFTPNRVKAFMPLIQDIQQKLREYIEQKLENDPQQVFDIREVAANFTTDAVASTIYGVDAESFHKEKPIIREMGKKLMSPSGWLMFEMILLFIFPFITKFYKTKFVQKEQEDFFINLTEQAIKQRQDSKVKRNDFLDYLMELKERKNLPEIAVAAHTITFFIDGFETSSIAIANAIYELANNRRAQEKLREEIVESIAKNGEMTFEAMSELPYLDQVFHETLRLHPPVLFLSRICTETVELINNGKPFKCEKETSVYVPAHAFHMDPMYYEDPTEFKPERFDESNGGVKSFKERGVYYPFGDGPRICLGMRFAYMQSKAAIIEIVKNFEISVNEKTQRPLIIDPKEFMNVKVGGLWLNMKKIQK